GAGMDAHCWAPPGRKCPMVVITGHRRENTGDGIEQICQAIATLAARFPDHHFVYPVHLNPNVLVLVNWMLSGLSNVRLIAHLGYRNFVALMACCRLLLTDSGGVQEEDGVARRRDGLLWDGLAEDGRPSRLGGCEVERHQWSGQPAVHLLGEGAQMLPVRSPASTWPVGILGKSSPAMPPARWWCRPAPAPCPAEPIPAGRRHRP